MTDEKHLTGQAIARSIPTPRAQNPGRTNPGYGAGLNDFVKGTRPDLWPTPRTRGLLGGSGSREMMQTLVESGALDETEAALMLGAKLWPTPTGRDWRSGKASPETMAKNSRPLSEVAGGQLNPSWVDWLMGFPIGWTALEALATDRFREWWRLHGGS
jgi:DNA (cytosine-5)-methyltransferase 1